MPARILGMIGVVPPSKATVHVIGGGLSPDWIVEDSRRHEAAGYDEVLVGYYSSSADGVSVALWGAAKTEKLSYLIAHRHANTPSSPRRLRPRGFGRDYSSGDGRG